MDSVAVYNLSSVRASRVFIPVWPPSTESVIIMDIKRVLSKGHVDVEIIIVVVVVDMHCRFDVGLN